MTDNLTILAFREIDDDSQLYIDGRAMGSLGDLSAYDLINMLGLDHDVAYAATNETPAKLENAEIQMTENHRNIGGEKV